MQSLSQMNYFAFETQMKKLIQKLIEPMIKY